MALFAAPNIEKLREERNVKGLIKALSHKDSQLRRDAAEALGRISGAYSALDAESISAAIDGLARALEDEDGAVGSAAAAALGGINNPRAVQTLGDLVGAGWRDPYLFDALLAALGGLGRPDVKQSAIEALVAPRDISVVGILLHQLEELELSPVVSAREQFGMTEKALSALVESLGERAIEPLMARFVELAPQTRNRVVRCLGRLGGEQAVEAYLVALRDQDPGIRWWAATGLGRIKATSAADALAEALDDEDKRVRAAASSALAGMGDPRATLVEDRIGALAENRDVEGLISTLGDINREEIRPRAAEALGDLADLRAVEPLIEALEERIEVEGKLQPDGSVIYHRKRRPLDSPEWSRLGNWPELLDQCVFALGRLGDPRAVEPLVRALDVPTKGQDKVVEALCLLPSYHVTPAVLDFLHRPRPDLLPGLQGPGWHGALQVLAAVGDERAAGRVLDLLGDGSVSSRALEALTAILRRHAADLPPSLLETIAEMNDRDQRQPVLDENHDAVVGYKLEPVDCSAARTLAREELERRGPVDERHETIPRKLP